MSNTTALIRQHHNPDDVRTIAEATFIDAVPLQFTIEEIEGGIVIRSGGRVTGDGVWVPSALRDWVARHAAVSPVAMLERVL